MQQQAKIEDYELCPSFNCYSSDTLTYMTAAKVIREEQEAAAPFQEFGDIEEEDFEFSLTLSDDEEIDPGVSWTIFPVFNRELMLKDEFKANDDGNEQQRVESSSYSSSLSSSETDELENDQPSGTFCVWRPKTKGSFSPKCKKSNSTGGSGSKKWIGFRYLLKRSNSEGRDPIVLLTPKQKQNSSKVTKGVGMLKGNTTPVHEQFYVLRRAENKAGKGKSYLPYRRDLIGLFANVRGIGKMLPF